MINAPRIDREHFSVFEFFDAKSAVAFALAYATGSVGVVVAEKVGEEIGECHEGKMGLGGNAVLN